MAWVEDLTAPATDGDAREAVTWLRHNWVLLAATAVIVAGLWEKGIVLEHGYFRQDDFYLFDWPLQSRLSWHLIGTIYTGHFMPGSLALAWFLAHLSLYDWTLASIVNLALLAAASFALLRVLRTMFGTRPAILIPLLVYMFCPLVLPGLTFWATTINWLPTQLAIFMAVNAHLHYVRGQRVWHAVAAAAWLVFGLLFDEADVFIPLLLLAVTSAFFVSGGWPRAVIDTIRRYWRGWVLYLLVLAGYAVVFVHQLHTSTQTPGKPGQFSSVLTFVSTLVRVSFVPSALGGPWHWYPNGPYAFADEVRWLTPASWCVAGVITLASLWYRRHAWRSWAILAAWIGLTAVVPLVIGRVGLASPEILGEDLHYLADSTPVLALCLGLAFWPVQGEQNPYRARSPRRPRQTAVVVVVAAFLAGSLYSCASYLTDTTSAPEASYISTARVALARAPEGTVIWSTPVPQQVQEATLYGRYGYTQTIAGLMAPAGAHLAWTRAPSGVVKNLMIFDNSGRLWGVLLNGWTMHPPAGQLGCFPVTARAIRIPLTPATPYRWSWELSMWYSGPAATMAVQFAGIRHDVQLPAGQHQVWIPAPGRGDSLKVKLLSGGPQECVSAVTIGGQPEPSILTKPLPRSPVPG